MDLAAFIVFRYEQLSLLDWRWKYHRLA